MKTEDRRQAILETATAVFREVGFGRASMAMIASRLGGSKGTLYSYFESKEQLFETAMKAASEGPGDQIMDLLDPREEDLRAVLKRFARAYLAFVCSKEVLAITRTAVAEGYGSSLGPHLYEGGPGRALAKMARFFARVMQDGRLRPGSAAAASLHFKGMIESGFLEAAMYGAGIQHEAAIDEAVEAFLRAYA